MATSPKYDAVCVACHPEKLLPFRAPEQAACDLARLVRVHLQPTADLPRGIATLLVWIAERAHAIPSVRAFVKALDLGPCSTLISQCDRAGTPKLKTVLREYRLALLAALCARYPAVSENDLALAMRFNSAQGLGRHLRKYRGLTYPGWTAWRTSVSLLTELPRVTKLLDHPAWRKLDRVRSAVLDASQPAAPAAVADVRYAYRPLTRAETALDL